MSINFNGSIYTLNVQDYASLEKKPFPLTTDVLKKVTEYSIYSQNPFVHNCIFVTTQEAIPYDKHRFAEILRLSLKLAYFQPAEISTPIVYIPEIHLECPSWYIKKTSSAISQRTINADSFGKVIQYFRILDGLDLSYEYTLEELYRMTSIDSDIISLLALWSFIEGFWYTDKEKIELSFNKMLKDYSPNDRNEERRVRAKIKLQNSIIRDSNINTVRVILAHGLYKIYEDKWSERQWQAIRQQRYFLFEIVFDSILNKLKNQNEVNNTISKILNALIRK